MCEITIAIPLYNAEAYIEQSLRTALEQDLSDIEVLVIDDRGTDRSAEKVRGMQRSHPRGSCIRIVEHDRNQGVAAARNTAIDQARGKYLYFLDSDDLLTPGSLSLLHGRMQAEGTQIAVGSFTRFYDGDPDNCHGNIYPDCRLEGEYCLTQTPYFSRIGTVWNILYPLETLRASGIRFRPLSKFEDITFLLEFLPTVQSCSLLSSVTYKYNIRPGSLCQYYDRTTIPLQEIEDDLLIRRHMKDICRTHKDTPYAAALCNVVMKRCLEAAMGVVKNRSRITPPVPRGTVRTILRYPLPAGTALRHGLHGTAYAFFGLLPEFLSIPALRILIKLLHR